MRRNKKYILLASALLYSTTNFAQFTESGELGEPKSIKENIPYSMYGIGTPLQNAQTIARGMGGAGIANPESASLNLLNPASISFLKNITLDFAIEGRRNNFSINDNTYTGGAASLSYFGLGIPFNKHIAMSLSFQPNSNMYYFAQDKINSANLGEHLVSYTGEGGLNQAQIGLAGQYKGISLGTQVGYLFGIYNKFKAISSNEDNASMTDAIFQNQERIGGVFWNLGALYHQNLKKDLFLSIGATASINQNFNINYSNFSISQTPIDNQIFIDTISANIDQKGTLSLPSSYSFGLGFGKTNSWKILADGHYTNWSEFSYLNDRRGITDYAYGANLGFEINPSLDREKANYFHVMSYRAGAYWKKDYLELENAPFQTIGASVGVSLPIRRQYNYFAKIHLSLDFGQRKSNVSYLGSDNFIKGTIGVSLNDIWFVRPKYD